MTTQTKHRAPAVFIPHGGGPMPLLNEPSQQAIAPEAIAQALRAARSHSGDQRTL